MSDFAAWLFQLVKDWLEAFWNFLTDIFISILELLLQAVLALFSAIPVPAFMTGGFSSALSAISPDVWYFASHFKIGQCMAILGAAVAFRLARKALTLFQW